jgi:hypothetical protein
MEDCRFSTKLVNFVPCREEGRIRKLRSEAAFVGEKTRNANRMKTLSVKQWAVQLKKLEEEMSYENAMVV